MVERLMRSSLTQPHGFEFVLSSRVTRQEVLSIPIGLGRTNEKSVYHYSFRFFDKNQEESELGVEIIRVTEGQVKDVMRLERYEYVAFRSDNPRTYPVIWRLAREPYYYIQTKAFYSAITGINQLTEKYVYTTPNLMASLRTIYWPPPKR